MGEQLCLDIMRVDKRLVGGGAQLFRLVEVAAACGIDRCDEVGLGIARIGDDLEPIIEISSLVAMASLPVDVFRLRGLPSRPLPGNAMRQ